MTTPPTDRERNDQSIRDVTDAFLRQAAAAAGDPTAGGNQLKAINAKLDAIIVQNDLARKKHEEDLKRRGQVGLVVIGIRLLIVTAKVVRRRRANR